MRYTLIIGYLLLFVLSAFSNVVAQVQPHLTVEAFEVGINRQDVQILDVRTIDEYNSGHIANALLADWNNELIFKERVRYLDKNKPVYTYCLAGSRSDAAADWLKKEGFGEVYSLQGGITSWKNKSKPVQRVEKVKQMTMKEFAALVPKHKTTLVDIGAPWCLPCQKMEPVLDNLQKANGEFFTLIRINGGEQEKLVKQLKVTELPVFIVYKGGREVWRKQGVVSENELLEHLK